ncbi:MAG: hypothetical protein JNM24_12490 [Bdellovibrionaceae bacterium]|nr:hypothetical protein [Pseudobdellovibrionaceae bacterium]
MLKRSSILISLIGILVLTFQNCSKGDGEHSMEYVVKKENTEPALVADEQILDVVKGISNNTNALFCFQNYITVFEWKNSSANLMSEKPVLGASKIVSLKLKEGILSDPRISSDWRVEPVLNTDDNGATSASLQFLKARPSTNSLDCFFMRVGGEHDLNAGLANVFFKDIGSEADANTFIGFLRHHEQFIACKVSSGQGNVELKSDDENSTLLSAGQAFVMKRGCY